RHAGDIAVVGHGHEHERHRGVAEEPAADLGFVEHDLVGEVLVVGQLADQCADLGEVVGRGGSDRHARQPNVGAHMTDDDLMAVLDGTVTVIRDALDIVEDWRPMTGKPTQYAIDVAADGPAVAHLTAAGLGVLSEESGLHHADRDITVVIDPIDGSTNASRGIPWFATSLAAVDANGIRASLVVNQATGERFDAVRGQGARRNGAPIHVAPTTVASGALVCFCGVPRETSPWGQGRVMGAASLDLCGVACGRFDGYLDNTEGIHGPWDYLGAMLVLTEAGGVIEDFQGRDLIHLVHLDKRGPMAASTPEMLADLRRFRASQ
ncbi:MAG: monophosphatase, partial [Actinomycetota bacterium]|nr:monophosphatase [Actinomycetota bacterium]